MTPYAREFTIVVATNNDITPLAIPGRCKLARIGIVRIGNGAIAADFYSRRFAGISTAVSRIVNDGNGKCRIFLVSSPRVRVGDVVTVASSSVAGYNTSHRITAVLADGDLVTDQTYTAAGAGGTLVLAIPAAEQTIYRVIPQVTGTDTVVATPDVLYINQDPLANSNIGVERKIYVKFAAAATYRINIQASEQYSAIT